MPRASVAWKGSERGMQKVELEERPSAYPAHPRAWKDHERGILPTLMAIESNLQRSPAYTRGLEGPQAQRAGDAHNGRVEFAKCPRAHSERFAERTRAHVAHQQVVREEAHGGRARRAAAPDGRRW